LEELCDALKNENENLMRQLNLGDELNNKISKALDENSRIKLEVNLIKK
jgi:hypothetical protein